MGMESFDKEEEQLFQSQAIEQERGLLRKFAGKAKNAASVLALVSALSAAPGMTTEAYGQQVPQTKTEQVIQNKINEANLTESSTWSRDLLNQVKDDLNKVKTDEDAQWLAAEITKVYSEWYLPTKGTLKEGPYGIKKREYSEDDKKLLAQNATEARKILQNLNMQHPIKGFERIDWQFGDMIKKIKNSMTYSSQRQEEISNHADDILENH
jgi:hypothetical protein